MNREIKFRAWNGVSILHDYLVARPQYADPLKIMTDEAFAKSQYGEIEWKVMQFTGLKDCNGRDIYEGDILGIESHYSGDMRIKIHTDEVIFEFGGFELKKYEGYGLSMAASNKICIVIGNIYQNPELNK